MVIEGRDPSKSQLAIRGASKDDAPIRSLQQLPANPERPLRPPRRMASSSSSQSGATDRPSSVQSTQVSQQRRYLGSSALFDFDPSSCSCELGRTNGSGPCNNGTGITHIPSRGPQRPRVASSQTTAVAVCQRWSGARVLSPHRVVWPPFSPISASSEMMPRHACICKHQAPDHRKRSQSRPWVVGMGR